MRPLSSLTNRIFLASTLLATVSIGAGVYFVSSRLRTQAEDDLRRDLVAAASLVDQHWTMLFENFTLRARLIADLPKLKAAVETRDVPTTEPIAHEYHEQAASNLFVVTDATGRVLVDIGGAPTLIDRRDEGSLIDKLRSGGPLLSFRPHPDGVLQVVTVPVTISTERRELLGTLTIGYLLDDERAATFKAVTGADIAFAFEGQVRSSTLPPEVQPQLATLVDADLTLRVNIGDSEYAALVRPLAVAAGAGVLETAVPKVLVLRSRTERMRTLSAIQTGMGVVALVTVLLAVAVSYGVARTITRPLARITDHMRQIAATGDLATKLPVNAPGWHDEDARVLATTFNTLTDSIARFQREAAQRERLSSLGRMSTIVAHEIRNPLMIIKGSLRQLTHRGASALDISEAAADIDGEIERLNRVVNEVLDFARPIRFERAPTDVNAVCRAAAAAVTAAEAAPPVQLELDAAAPAIESDADKIRTVLVNILANARQATAPVAGESGEARDLPVVLSTVRISDRRLAIVVRDSGAGIAADDLPRIFDPFFTTRRTGTGLGLAIARNIIDTLGGTITVTSTPGTGTRIRIELGDAPLPRS